MRLKISFIAAIVALIVSPAPAADYNNWVPLLPDAIGGMAKAGDPTGANMQSAGQTWSALEQKYEGNGSHASLKIITGYTAPQVRQFQAMQQFNMEDGEKIVKSLMVSGNKALMNIKKDGSSGTLIIAVKDNTLVAIESSAASSEEALKSLAEDVPLSDIADAVE